MVNFEWTQNSVQERRQDSTKEAGHKAGHKLHCPSCLSGIGTCPFTVYKIPQQTLSVFSACFPHSLDTFWGYL